MTSRERVLRALHHEKTDRVPFNMRFAPDLARKIMEFVGKEDLDAYFDYDIRFVGYVSDQRTSDFSEYLGEIPENASVSPWGVASVLGVYWFDAGKCCSHTGYLAGIDMPATKAISISHTHMDHIGRLPNLLWTLRKLSSVSTDAKT